MVTRTPLVAGADPATGQRTPRWLAMQRGEALPQPVPRLERRGVPRLPRRQAPGCDGHHGTGGGDVLAHGRRQARQHVGRRGGGHVEHLGDDSWYCIPICRPARRPTAAASAGAEHRAQLGQQRPHVVHGVVALDLRQPPGVPADGREVAGRTGRRLAGREAQPFLGRQRTVLLDVVAHEPDTAVRRQRRGDEPEPVIAQRDAVVGVPAPSIARFTSVGTAHTATPSQIHRAAGSGPTTSCPTRRSTRP